jgi:hypothetical protein
MKGQWASNINFWFRLMYYQKWNCASAFMCDLYIPRTSLPLLIQPNRQTAPGIYKVLKDTWMYELGTRPHRFISGKTKIGFQYSVGFWLPMPKSQDSCVMSSISNRKYRGWRKLIFQLNSRLSGRKVSFSAVLWLWIRDIFVGSGSESPDPYQWHTEPDPALFISSLQDGNKK